MEEQEKAIEKVGIDNLCLDFTWPGYENIQLKRGGKDELVTADNVEQYLEVSFITACCYEFYLGIEGW